MISCKDCDASYVEQISRQLKTKISEHKNHIRVDMEVRLKTQIALKVKQFI